MRTRLGHARPAALVAAGLASLAGLSSHARAATFASDVASYNPGAAVANDAGLKAFTNPRAATGSPDDLSGENSPFPPSVLTPFSPPFEADEITLVGEGGQLTLRLPNYAVAGAGREIGVFSNVGLQDRSFTSGGPAGTNTNPASTFGGGTAEVRVSEDGRSFVSLGRVTFNLPANFYRNVSGPYVSEPPAPPDFADFGEPFNGTLASFDGKSFAQTLETLGASAGGTWIDIDASGLERVGYVQFLVSDDTAGIDRLAIDAVSISNSRVGAVVPEPAGLAIVAAAAGVALLGRRRRVRRAR